VKGTAESTLLPPITPYSHSILSMHRNALIFMRKSFLMTV
jgi:hypothetical protein